MDLLLKRLVICFIFALGGIAFYAMFELYIKLFISQGCVLVNALRDLHFRRQAQTYFLS